MKITTLILLAMFIGIHTHSQSIKVQLINSTDYGIAAIDIVNNKDIEIPETVKEIKSITIKCANLPANHKLEITAVGETKNYTLAGSETKLDFATNLLTNEITIKHFDNSGNEITADLIKFKLIPKNLTTSGKVDGDEQVVGESIDEYLRLNYSTLESTPFGYIDPNDKDKKVHIFFDYFGNSLLSTIPSGISNAQYIAHIIYPFSLADPNKISYSIKQKTGSFNNALIFNNSNIRASIPEFFQSGKNFDGITERTFLLGTATDDLSFDIVTATNDKKVSKTVLESYTIKMSPVYHGSFDIGFIRSDLSNPDFNLVQLPNSTDQVVKQTDDSPKGIVTVMASFYVSPVILLQSVLGKKKVPFYKLTGRNFLDDHKFYERFYPTIGVSVSDKSFENIFYGINWEIARGLSVFGGWHYGKVNTFEMPNFEAGVTPVSNDEFEFYKNTRWRTSTAVGIKLDIMIVRNLFTTVSAGQ